MNINFNPEMIKPRRRKLYQECDTITSGYIDLIPKIKMNGNERTYLHDAFIKAGYMFEKNICDELYRESPPMKYTNASFCWILQLSGRIFILYHNQAIEKKKVVMNVF